MQLWVIMLLVLAVLLYVACSPAREHFESDQPTILVSIAAYRDSECQATLKSVFAKAKHPSRVYAAVVEQNKEASESCGEPADSVLASNVRRISIPHTDARGPTYARYLAYTMYKGEDYYFQIDSHTRFEENWDVDLIEMVRSHPGKSLLSHYPPTHDHTPQADVPALCKTKWDDNGIPTLDSKYVKPDGRRVPFVAGGMMFAPGACVRQVPFDQHLPDLFQGEEILYSARLFTHGWDVYTPSKSVISHYYAREDAPKVWSDRKDFDQKHSVAKVKHILKLSEERPPNMAGNLYLGTERTLVSFWQFAGLDPATKSSTTESMFCP